MISEKIELLGKGLYSDIPDQLTLSAIPTTSELDYVGSEDFEAVMLDKILPAAVQEKINFRKLLEIDFHWICRCLRFLNYGPYFTTNVLFCPNCGRIEGEARVNLRSVGCKVLPEGFVNDIVIGKDEFIDFHQDVHLKLLTVQESINAINDPLFKDATGKSNRDYARICYSITSIGKEKDITPVNAKIIIEKEMSSADYIIFKDLIRQRADFGLRAGGSAQCPRCGAENATFLALVDDRFLRPTVGDLKAGRDDRSVRGNEIPAGSEAGTVRKDS